MQNVLKLAPLPLLAVLVVACSGGAEEASSPVEREASLALEPARDAVVVDKGRADGDGERHGGRRHHHGRGHQPPAPEPRGASCAAAGQTFPDGGAVPSGDSCNTCSCSDGSVNCTLALCEPSICATFIEAPDGVCSRFPLDPCRGQDPDCTLSDGSCEVAGETFPDGSAVPSGDSCNSCSCSEGGVLCTLALCEPVVCALFVEAPDGECSRFPLDPCRLQDPDCAEPSEPTDPVTPLEP